MHVRNSLGAALRAASCCALIAATIFATRSPRVLSQAGQSSDSQTFLAAQLVQPADLAHELASASADSRPTIVYVGFRALFAGGHIPGATYHGTASTEQGLAEIKRWAASLPRATNLVIYCGCCPFQHCPNVRPAFALFQDMRFTRIRVLELQASFAADWAARNYPVEKGSS